MHQPLRCTGRARKDGVIVIKTKRGRIGKPQVSYTGNFSTYLKPSYNNFNILNSADQMSVYAEIERKGLFNHSVMSMLPNGGVYKKMYDLINDSYNEETDQFELLNTPEERRAYLQRYATANTDWFDQLFKILLFRNIRLAFPPEPMCRSFISLQATSTTTAGLLPIM